MRKDLPEQSAGYSFFLKGNQYSFDGKSWQELFGITKRIYDIRNNVGWVRYEPTDLPDDRPHLQTLFPDIPLYTIREALEKLGWEYDDTEVGAENIRCCGERVKLSGWIGVEYGYCAKCQKGFQDMTGFLPSGNSTITHVDFDKIQCDDGRRFSIDYLPWNGS